MSSSSRRVVIITGAAEGIGRGIPLRLAKDGYDLGLFDLPSSQEKLDQLSASIRSEHGVRVVNVPGSVAEEADVRRLVAAAVQELGSLYAMIANAGISINGVLHETSSEDLDSLINANVKDTFFCYKYAAEQLIKRGKGGRIIGACSTAGKKGMPGASIYSATKFAVRGLTQSAAADYGKVCIVERLDEFHTSTKGLPKGLWTAGFSGLATLGRNGQPEDVAKLVSFIVSDDAAFITGQSYIVDGGFVFD